VSLKKEEPVIVVEAPSSPDVSQPEKKNEVVEEAPEVSQSETVGEEEASENPAEDGFRDADRSRGRGYRNGRGGRGRGGRGRGGYGSSSGNQQQQTDNWDTQRSRRQGGNKRYHERGGRGGERSERGGERSERGGSPRTHRPPQNQQNQ